MSIWLSVTDLMSFVRDNAMNVNSLRLFKTKVLLLHQPLYPPAIVSANDMWCVGRPGAIRTQWEAVLWRTWRRRAMRCTWLVRRPLIREDSAAVVLPTSVDERTDIARMTSGTWTRYKAEYALRRTDSDRSTTTRRGQNRPTPTRCRWESIGKWGRWLDGIDELGA